MKKKRTRKPRVNKKVCPACLVPKVLTKHHILPKRYFKSSPILELCRECHDALERSIETNEAYSGKRKRLRRNEYYRILIRFLRGG